MAEAIACFVMGTLDFAPEEVQVRAVAATMAAVDFGDSIPDPRTPRDPVRALRLVPEFVNVPTFGALRPLLQQVIRAAVGCLKAEGQKLGMDGTKYPVKVLRQAAEGLEAAIIEGGLRLSRPGREFFERVGKVIPFQPREGEKRAPRNDDLVEDFLPLAEEWLREVRQDDPEVLLSMSGQMPVQARWSQLTPAFLEGYRWVHRRDLGKGRIDREGGQVMIHFPSVRRTFLL